MINYSRDLKILDSADVVVAGGGPSGVAASVAAARQGKKVILLEQSGTLGGSSSLALVAELMNFDDGEKFVSNGIGREIFEKLGLEITSGRKWFNVRYEELKRVYDALVIEAGVCVFFYTRIVDSITNGEEITHVVVSGPGGMGAIEGKVFIDCTGSGSLAVSAGAESLYGDENGNTMSATICTLWGGVDFDKKGISDAAGYEEAYKNGVFSEATSDTYSVLMTGTYKVFPVQCLRDVKFFRNMRTIIRIMLKAVKMPCL